MIKFAQHVCYFYFSRKALVSPSQLLYKKKVCSAVLKNVTWMGWATFGIKNYIP